MKFVKVQSERNRRTSTVFVAGSRRWTRLTQVTQHNTCGAIHGIHQTLLAATGVPHNKLHAHGMGQRPRSSINAYSTTHPQATSLSQTTTPLHLPTTPTALVPPVWISPHSWSTTCTHHTGKPTQIPSCRMGCADKVTGEPLAAPPSPSPAAAGPASPPPPSHPLPSHPLPSHPSHPSHTTTVHHTWIQPTLLAAVHSGGHTWQSSTGEGHDHSVHQTCKLQPLRW